MHIKVRKYFAHTQTTNGTNCQYIATYKWYAPDNLPYCICRSHSAYVKLAVLETSQQFLICFPIDTVPNLHPPVSEQYNQYHDNYMYI